MSNLKIPAVSYGMQARPATADLQTEQYPFETSPHSTAQDAIVQYYVLDQGALIVGQDCDRCFLLGLPTLMVRDRHSAHCLLCAGTLSTGALSEAAR